MPPAKLRVFHALRKHHWAMNAVSLLLALGVGCWFKDVTSKSLCDYSLGGRKFPWFIAWVCMVAIFFAANTPLWAIEKVAQTSDPEEIQIVPRHSGWIPEPFRHGYGVMERQYGISTYDRGNSEVSGSRFPIDRIAGTVRIPVFLVDWSDFNPTTDPSNKDNPRSVFPDYQQHSAEEIEAHLNSDTGAAGYFKAASGGQLILHFDVFPWISSNESDYLKDKEPAYYHYVEEREGWIASKKPMARDVLRAAVAEKGFDPREYDADQNKVIDGMIIAYEGKAGALSGKNMSSLAPLNGTMAYFKKLFPEDDPNAKLTEEMDILFHRYINQPENTLMELRTTVHEVGHMLLGYTDYYHFGELGEYALSARGAHFSPPAMEKWLFGKWIRPKVVTSGKHLLDSHHLKVGERYSDEKTYLHQIFIGNDPHHFLLIENRFFNPETRYFDQQHPPAIVPHPESGLVIFEVNENLANRKKWEGQSIIRHVPESAPPRTKDDRRLDKRRTFQEGETFHWTNGTFEVHITDVSHIGERMTYQLSTNSVNDSTPPTPPGDVTITRNNDGSAKIEWSPSRDNTAVSGYFFDIATDPDFKRLHEEYANKNVRLNTTYLMTRLEMDTPYFLRIWAMDVSGNLSTPAKTYHF
jgi:M6 family metalloprotease-like protein